MKRLTSLLRTALKGIERPLVDGLFVALLFATVIAAGWLIAQDDR